MSQRNLQGKRVRKLKQLSLNRTRTREEKKAKAAYEQYRRRRKCLGKKSDELHQFCRAKVFLLVVDESEQQSHFYSTETLSDSWPPSGATIAASCNAKPIPIRAPKMPSNKKLFGPKERGDSNSDDTWYEPTDEDTGTKAEGADTTPPCSTTPQLVERPPITAQHERIRSFLSTFQLFSSRQAAVFRDVRTSLN